MKNLILFFALSLLTIPLFGQTKFSIHAGPSASWVAIDGVSSDILPERSMQWTAQAGLGIETKLDEHFSFVSGLDFARRGFQSQITEQITLFKIDIPIGAKAITTMDYLSAPVKFKYTTNQKPVSFYVEAGPRLNYAIDGRVKTKATFLVDFNTGTYDLNPSSDLFHRFELGGELGAGIQWEMPSGEMQFGLQYYHSFTNSLDDPILAVDFRNRSLGAHLGYAFKF